MNYGKLPFNWFDVVLIATLVLGVFAGRKRGLSAELSTMLQWITTVFVCAFAYQPLGDWLATAAVLSHLFSYISTYVALAAGVSFVFLILKRLFFSKLLGSDVFGRGEFYLGMPAGMLRFACMLIAGLALLNARFYTQQEIKAYEAFQKEMYGSEFFPGLQAMQADVFQRSLTGPCLKKYLSFLLIKPTAPERKEIKQREWNMP